MKEERGASKLNLKTIGPKRYILLTKHQNVFTIISFPNHGKSYKNKSRSSQNIIDIMHKDQSGSDIYHHLYTLSKPHIEYNLNSRGRKMSRRWKCIYYILI